MKRNAFTLIELMAVLIILSLLSVIVVPTITKSLNNSKETAYEAQLDQIKKGAKGWATDHSRELPIKENDKINITLGGLIQAGYLESEIKNPVTQENFPNCMYIEIKRYKNNYVYTVLDNELDEGCTNTNNPNAPRITLKGSKEMEVNIGDSFEDPGATATSATGSALGCETTYEKQESDGTYKSVEQIDTSKVGVYRIKYSVSDEGGEVSIIRKVTVKDKTPPVITVDGKTERFIMNITKGSTFTIPEATASDNEDGDLTDAIVISGNVNVNVEGRYNLVYSVKDTAGNVKTLTVVVIVE